MYMHRGKDPCHSLATNRNIDSSTLSLKARINILIILLVNSDNQAQSFSDWWELRRREREKGEVETSKKAVRKKLCVSKNMETVDSLSVFSITTSQGTHWFLWLSNPSRIFKSISTATCQGIETPTYSFWAKRCTLKSDGGRLNAVGTNHFSSFSCLGHSMLWNCDSYLDIRR